VYIVKDFKGLVFYSNAFLAEKWFKVISKEYESRKVKMFGNLERKSTKGQRKCKKK